MDRKTFKSHINADVLTKLFFEITEERYPSSQKIKQLISKMTDPLNADAIEKLYVKIYLLNAIRNMIKDVAPNQLYRSMQHRDDLYMAVIESSEDLEEELEELEEGQMAEENKDT